MGRIHICTRAKNTKYPNTAATMAAAIRPPEAAQHRAPGMADEISGDDTIRVARDPEIGDLAETQDAAISPQQTEPERHRNVEEIVRNIVGGEIREIERNREEESDHDRRCGPEDRAPAQVFRPI